MAKLTRQQRKAMLDAYLAGKSSGLLARKFKVHRCYPGYLAWATRNPDKAKQPHRKRADEEPEAGSRAADHRHVLSTPTRASGDFMRGVSR